MKQCVLASVREKVNQCVGKYCIKSESVLVRTTERVNQGMLVGLKETVNQSVLVSITKGETVLQIWYYRNSETGGGGK